MAHVQGPGGVGGHELHLNPAAAARAGAAEGAAGCENVLHQIVVGALAEKEIDEARARHLDPGHALRRGQIRDHQLGDVPGLALRHTRKGEGNRAREITVVAATAALHGHGGSGDSIQLAARGQAFQGVAQQ